MHSADSIRVKFRRLILFTSVMVLLLSVLTFVTYEIFTFRRSHIEIVSSIAEVVADNATGALSFQNEEDASSLLKSLRSQQTIQRAVLYDSKGRIFAWYPASQKATSLPAAPGRIVFATKTALSSL